MDDPKHSLILYRTPDGSLQVDVSVKDETIWLSQADIATLFGVNVPAISKHVKNIFETGELRKKATVSTMETVRKEGKRTVRRTVDAFNLDMIIAVGYRVNSRRATAFRIWATQVLRQHMLKGYTINQPRLLAHGVEDFEQAVALVRRAAAVRQLSAGESAGLLRIITDYANTWLLLKEFDDGKLQEPRSTKTASVLSSRDIETAVASLKKNLLRRREATGAFGEEKGRGLAPVLKAVFPGGKVDVGVEEQAALLLYEIVKQRPFADGNKRIAAFLFILFLTRNRVLVGRSGERKFNDNALVALTLLTHQSTPAQRDLLLRLIMHFVRQ